jgi:dTDP-4-amino-4,6-dideoxygalactose transaminase
MPDGYEKSMAPFQARLLRTATGQVEANWDHRRHVAKVYAESLAQIGLKPFTVQQGTEPVMVRYPVLVSDKRRTLDAARKARIEIGDWFVSPLHPLTDHLDRIGYRSGECPVAESVSQNVVNLPTHPRVDDDMITRTCEFLRQIGS